MSQNRRYNHGLWAVLMLVAVVGILIMSAAGWTAEQIGNAVIITILIVAAWWLVGLAKGWRP